MGFVVVEIGASFGGNATIVDKYIKDGARGVLFECDPYKYQQLVACYGSDNCSSVRVTPYNVCRLFEIFDVPKDFYFLSIDIDGYDNLVLREILKKYSPKKVHVEVNDKIPSGIFFEVLYSEDYAWGINHFYGMSIETALYTMRQFGYSAVSVSDGCNIVFDRDAVQVNCLHEIKDWSVLQPWNEDVKHWHDIGTDCAMKEIESYFSSMGKKKNIDYIIGGVA